MRALKATLLAGAFVLLGAHGTAPTPYVFKTLPYFPEMPVALDNPVTVEGAALGRKLFHDPILSRDGSLSCASCHKQRYAFSGGPERFSIGSSGARMKRNTPPLFNLAWYPAFFWDGRAATLEEQVLHPVREADELGSDWPSAIARINATSHYAALLQDAFGTPVADSTLAARAIAQYLRTLISANSRFDRALRREIKMTDDEFAGFVLANEQDKGDCLQCHTTDRDALGTNRIFSNNGLDSAAAPSDYPDAGLGAVTKKPEDMGRFKVPSLRNVAVTAPYMHDGRFATLEEVLEFYNSGVHAGVNTDARMGNAHAGGARLTKEQTRQLLAFLHALTDSSFLVDPAHADQ